MRSTECRSSLRICQYYRREIVSACTDWALITCNPVRPAKAYSQAGTAAGREQPASSFPPVFSLFFAFPVPLPCLTMAPFSIPRAPLMPVQWLQAMVQVISFTQGLVNCLQQLTVCASDISVAEV